MIQREAWFHTEDTGDGINESPFHFIFLPSCDQQQVPTDNNNRDLCVFPLSDLKLTNLLTRPFIQPPNMFRRRALALEPAGDLYPG